MKDKIYLHIKTGNHYIVLTHRMFRIPFFGTWISLIEYVSCNDYKNGNASIYTRFEFDFKRKFRLLV